MSSADLKAYVLAKPFRIFRLRTTEGVTYEIRHPDLIAVGRTAAQIAVSADPGSNGKPDTEVVIFPGSHHPHGADSPRAV